MRSPSKNSSWKWSDIVELHATAIWLGNNPELRDRLLTLQKSLVRIISGASPLFAKLATLKIVDLDLFVQSFRIFSYKDMLLGAMASMISKKSHKCSTRGARSNATLHPA